MKHRVILFSSCIALILLFSALMPVNVLAQDRVQLGPICDIIQISDNSVDDYDPQMEPGILVYASGDGIDAEIWLWDTAGQVNISNNPGVEDRNPQLLVSEAGDIGVVWETWDSTDSDWEIVFYDGTSAGLVTDNTIDDTGVAISDEGMAWTGDDGTDTEIYFFDGTSVTNISNDAVNQDGDPGIDGSIVVWEKWDGLDPTTTEIFVWAGGEVIQVTTDSVEQRNSEIAGQYVVWEGWDGNSWEIYQYNMGAIYQITNNNFDSLNPAVDADGNIVYESFRGNNLEIFKWNGYYEDRLTENGQEDYDADVSGEFVSWTGETAGGSISNAVFYDSSTQTILSDQLVWEWNQNTKVVDGWIVWQAAETSDLVANDWELFLADCSTYYPYPDELEVFDPYVMFIDNQAEPYTTAPVTPLVRWHHHTSAGETNAPGYQFRLYLDGPNPVDITVDASEVCDGLDCEMFLEDYLPEWGLMSGTYDLWIGAIQGSVSAWNPEPVTFTVTIPPAALPGPIQVNPADGRIAIHWPYDPNTLWVQVWVGAHSAGNYFEWHERGGLGNRYTCTDTLCTIYPKWDVPTASGLSVWMQAWGPGGFSIGGTAAPGAPSWNQLSQIVDAAGTVVTSASTFDLPSTPATLPSNIGIAGGTSTEPAIGWTGGADSTWYNVVITPAGSTTAVHTSWHPGVNAGCWGALADPADYDCAKGGLGLASELTAGSYDIYVGAWGPGGFATGGSTINTLGTYGKSAAPFTYPYVASSNAAPVLATNAGLTVTANDVDTIITTAVLQTTDADNTAAQLVYTVTAVPTSGTLELSNVALAVNDTFTQADIDGSLVTYTETGGVAGSDSFDFSVTDGVNTPVTGTFSITIN